MDDWNYKGKIFDINFNVFDRGIFEFKECVIDSVLLLNKHKIERF